jgi:hypothetical protein
MLAVTSRGYADPSAPPPDQASGIETDDRTPVGEKLLVVPRVLLLVPRAVVWTVAQPIRGAAYAYDEYSLPSKFRHTFFNVDGTFGIYPIATYQSDFGFTGGGRVVHRDLFGQHERIKLRADFGGRFRYGYGARFRSGQRFGAVELQLDSGYERRPREKFYGIGNAGTAVRSVFQEDVVRNVATLDFALPSHLHARLSGAAMVRDFGGGDIMTKYDTSQIVGFDSGVRNIYVEPELVYDTRRPASMYESDYLDGAGWLVGIHGGIARGYSGDVSRFTTAGGEVEHYFDLYRGSRTLAVRALVDGVIGDEQDIPFIDLPRLGGNELLRGFATGRFRDRVAALGTVEYAWDIGNFFGSYVFLDAGRTYHSFGDVELADFHFGYGGGVQLHTMKSFIARVQVAASDGELFLELALAPAFGRRERAGRY